MERSRYEDEERARAAVPADDLHDSFCGTKENGGESNTEDAAQEKSTLACNVDECSDSGDQQCNGKSHVEKSVNEVHEERKFDKPLFYQENQRLQAASSNKLHETDPVNILSTHEAYSAENTLCEVVAAHYNNVPEAGLDERNKSRILHLRNFNNWIKSMLIDEYVNEMRDSKPRGSSLKVLDMGCGKGGDLFKWRQGKITHLVCSDIAATSIAQCKDRYNDMKQRAMRERNFSTIFTAEFIIANCTKERLREQYEDVTLQLDLVSCQFAFHYCFESLPQAECMMRNAAECLRPGGYFFGTCPNANAIVSRVRKAGGKIFGNDVYSVEFETPLSDGVPPPIFGSKYNFHMEGVVDCPEFLVHFPTLIR